MLLLSLVIATAGLSAVLIINDSAKESYGVQDHFLVPNVAFQVQAKTPKAPLRKEDYAKLRKQGFTGLIAVAQGRQPVFYQDQKVSERNIDFTGIDSLVLPPLPSIKAANSGNHTSPLAGFSLSRPLAVLHPSLLQGLSMRAGLDSEELAKALSIKVNHRAYALPTLYPYEHPSLGNDIILDIGAFYRLFPDNPLSGLFWVTDIDAAQFDGLKQKLLRALPEHLSLVAINNNQQQNDLTQSFHLNLMAMALLMFIVCLFIVLNAVNLLLNSRMPWLKICRQLGIPRHSILQMQLAEMVLVTLLASLIGMLLGITLANIVSPAVQATLEGLYDVEVGFGTVSLFSLFVQVFGISLVGCLIAVFMPLKNTENNLNGADSHLQSSAQRAKSHRVFLGLCLLLATVTVVIFTSSQPLWLLLVGTGCLILAGCSVLLAYYPKVLTLMASLVPDSMPLLQISIQQSVSISRKTKIACCAFFIAATSNIGMNLMVDSFRNATFSWLESRLAADHYLYYKGDIPLQPLAEKANIQLLPRFENIIPFQGLNIQQYSYPTTQTFKQAMVFYDISDSDKAWQAFEAGQGVFVNQQFAFHFELGLEDTIVLPHPSTQIDSSYVIKGVYYDFGSPKKQTLLPLSEYSGDISGTSIYAISSAPQGLETFRALLDEVGINQQQSLLARSQLLALSMETFDRTFLITDGLNIVTLLVAALSLACGIVVLMNDVRPQNMLIRSMGISAFKIQALALFQYMLLCMVALLFASPFGILLSWVLIHEINYQAFQWTYPLQVSLFNIFQIYAVSLTVVLLVIAMPIIRAGKKPLIEDIRWLN
jgi:putative ABC transport system permease protein